MGDLLKSSYPVTFIFNDPINYSISGMLMGHGGLEANHRNLLPFGSSSSPAPGAQAAQGSPRLLSPTDSHCSPCFLG